MEKKSPDAFRTISEVAEWLGVPTHVLRFWESRFSQVKPVKRAGGRRYYRPSDMELLGGIRKLLHEDGMTIRGVQKLLREEGAKHVAAMSPSLDSDDMRDVTPSNVVPLDVQSTDTTSEVPKEPRERAEADLVEDAEIVEAQELAAENNAIETELIGEERRLTEQRSTLQAQEFRTLADEFDQRVQRIRQEQDEKARDLTRTRDEARAAFFKEVAAIISDIVREKGALVVIDRRDVFLSADRIDITDEAIQRVNEAEGLTVE